MIFSVILAIAGLILFFMLPAKFITPALFFLFPFIISVTLITSYILIRESGGRFIRFLNIYMIITIVKLFLYFAVLVVYIMLNKKDLLPFSITFMVLYLLYTIFEVIWLVRFSKRSRS
jgi:hypothetical protein